MSVTFEDVAVYFSAEEWAELAAWQRRLYREVMMENYQEVAALGRLAAKPEIISKMEREETPCVPAPSAARQRHRTPEPAASGPRTRREARGVPEGLPAPATPLPGMPKRGRRQQGGSARSRPARNRGGPSGRLRLHPPPAPRPLEKPPRACPECDASFRSGTALATHLRSHVGERPFGCPRCGTGFPSKGGLKRHQKTHVGKPDPPGPGASPGLPAKLPPSRRPHGPLAPRRPHACADCGEHFGQRRHPLSHQRAPTGERPVACARCPKAFGDKKTLAVPRRVTTAAASAARAVARSRT